MTDEFSRMYATVSALMDAVDALVDAVQDAGTDDRMLGEAKRCLMRAESQFRQIKIENAP